MSVLWFISLNEKFSGSSGVTFATAPTKKKGRMENVLFSYKKSESYMINLGFIV